MRLEEVTAEIRPRSDWEAVDLGLAMVRRDFWRCISVWWLALIIPTVLAGWWLWESPTLWLMLYWWWKPAGSRMVLFEISRRLFGERPSWKSSLREIPRAWWRRFFYRFVWARFSPWLPVTLAVEDLEGLRGKAYKQRCGQVTRRGEGAIMWMYFISDTAAVWFGLAIFAVVFMLLPTGQDGALQLALEGWDINDPTSVPPLIMRIVTCCVMASMSLTDLFVIGSGFGIYLNSRTWVEGWDVEIAFKRMARRLTNMTMLWLVFACLAMSGVCHAAGESDAEVDPKTEDVIREVKSDPAFKVHTVTDKVPKPWKLDWNWPSWLKFSGGSIGGASLVELLKNLFILSAIGLLVGLIAWLIWKNRHAFAFRLGGGTGIPETKKARVVMGMDVSPETLPNDIPTTAWELWCQGRHQDALGLLYRGSISRVIEVGHVEIRESDTEGDCVRRVDQAGDEGHPDYFRGITGAWIGLAYAGLRPADHEVESLCQRWPFSERRKE